MLKHAQPFGCENKGERHMDVAILNGVARVMRASKGTVSWSESGREDMLIFKTICKIEPINRSEGITGCCFRVRRRAFRDLSFREGRVIQSYGGRL